MDHTGYKNEIRVIQQRIHFIKHRINGLEGYNSAEQGAVARLAANIKELLACCVK